MFKTLSTITTVPSSFTASQRNRRIRAARLQAASSVTPASVIFFNEDPDLIDGSENYITFKSANTIAGAAGNDWRVTLYSNQASLWKTIIWDPNRVNQGEYTTNGGIEAHIANVNRFLGDYVTAEITGTIPNNVTYSAGTGVGGSFPMSGGIG